MSVYNGYKGKRYQPYNIWFLYIALALFTASFGHFLFLSYARFLGQLYAVLGAGSLLVYLLGLVPSFATFGKAAYYAQRVLLVGAAVWIVTLLIVEAMISSHARPSDNSIEKASGADYLIVLGAGLNGRTPSRVLTSRLDSAVRYYHENPDTVVVVTGGRGEGEDITESEAMRTYLEEHGVPSAQIVEENLATSTLENLRFSFALIDRHAKDKPGSPEIAVVSSEFHLYRTSLIADREDRRISLIAAQTPGFYLKLTYAVREYFSLLKGLFFH